MSGIQGFGIQDSGMTDVEHEHRDINIRAVIGFMIGLIVVALVVQVLMWLLFGHFAGRAAREDPPRPPLGAAAGRLPPEPRLQTTPAADLRKLRAREHEILASYGWVDRAAGTVRIPIDRAMELLLERGLPPTPTAPPPPAPPVAQPSPPRGQP